jgi:cytochrome b subunit of formate dehydrogenase
MTTAFSEVKPSTNGEYIIAKRYSRKIRYQHWGNAIAMILFFITGIELYFKSFIISYNFTQTLHIYLGVFIVFWSIILYPIFVTMDKKWHTIIPTIGDFKDLWTIILCAFRILPDERYPKYDFYDPEKKVYIRKYHPTQKLLAFGNLVMLILIAITGFALYETLVPNQFFGLGGVSLFILTPILSLGVQLRFLHYLIFLYFLFATISHFYFTQLPSNRGRLKGMITGNEPIKTTKGSKEE